MDSVFAIKLPKDHWWPIGQAPKDGRIVFIRDGFGYIDLAKWSNEEWTAEFGVCDEPTQFQYVSIEDSRSA